MVYPPSRARIEQTPKENLTALLKAIGRAKALAAQRGFPMAVVKRREMVASIIDAYRNEVMETYGNNYLAVGYRNWLDGSYHTCEFVTAVNPDGSVVVSTPKDMGTGR